MKYHLFKLYLTITRFMMSFRQRNRYHIGTRIYHTPTGRVMYITDCNNYIRGVQYFKLRSNDDGKVFNKVSRLDIEKIPDVKNWWHDSTAWWRWYKACWLEMDAKSMARGEQPRSVYVLGKDRATAKR